MIIRSLSNNGEVFRGYKMPAGYFVTSQFGIQEGKEYIVMGMILSEGVLSYLIDDGGIPLLCPFQLFEIVDSSIDVNWHFRIYTLGDDIYPYKEAVWGYYELCFDEKHYELLVEQQEAAVSKYFKIKESIILSG